MRKIRYVIFDLKPTNSNKLITRDDRLVTGLLLVNVLCVDGNMW